MFLLLYMTADKVFFIRHAESVLNQRTDLLGGHNNDTPLSKKGIEQAKILGRCILEKGLIPTTVYSSPALRTNQTLYYAFKEIGYDVAPKIIDDVHELSQGDWQALPKETVLTDEIISTLKKQGKDFRSPNGESINQVGERMLGFLYSETIASHHDSDTVLVFSHGYAIRCLASALENWSIEKILSSQVPNTSISLASWDASRWNMNYVGKNPADI